MNHTKIEVKHLTKRFEKNGESVTALLDVNLEIEQGQIYGIIGMSGAGKSTLIRCFNYLEKPTEGKVLIDNLELNQLSEKELRTKRRQIAMIFQNFNLLMQKSVLDNVSFPLLLRKENKKEAHEEARKLLEIVGLSDKEKAYPSQLSGGQKQRVAIARALASHPEILLCDEATSALDPQTTNSILDLLKDINKKMGITIVMITHQMHVVRKICDKVAIIENGSIVENGNVEDIFKHPKSKAAKKLIFEEDQEPQKIERLNSECKIRIVFDNHSSFEPVISNMVIKFKEPVNILKANTKNIGGIAKGEMILGLPLDTSLQEQMKRYLLECGLDIEEVNENVE